MARQGIGPDAVRRVCLEVPQERFGNRGRGGQGAQQTHGKIFLFACPL